MCSQQFHNCPACNEEYRCDQHDNECNSQDICAKCEYWIDEERKETERYERMMWERNEWIRENGYEN